MSQPKLKWSNKDDDPDFDAALKYLSLLASDTRAEALVRSLRGGRPVEHATKDLLRPAQLPTFLWRWPDANADGTSLSPVRRAVQGPDRVGRTSNIPFVITRAQQRMA
jgi:hypothetical protein